MRPGGEYYGAKKLYHPKLLSESLVYIYSIISGENKDSQFFLETYKVPEFREAKGFWKVGAEGESISGSINLIEKPSQHDKSRYKVMIVGGNCPFYVKMWEQQGLSIIFRDMNSKETARVKYIRKGYWEGNAKRKKILHI